MKYLQILLILMIFISCEKSNETAQEIVDKAIENAGGEKYENAEISFDFRNISYRSSRKAGKFRLERFQKDTLLGEIHDVLDNKGFARYLGESKIELPDSLVQAYTNSVNSVHYFMELPYGLNDPAVNKKLIGKDSIEGREYYEIRVTFDKQGGGEDHQDEYLYWIDTQNFGVDYLAYNYETEGGGVRFRKAINPRRIEGIRFVDYQNYGYNDINVELSKLDNLYEAGQLFKVSDIRNKNIEVNLNPDF
ncbi:deoxyribose-phosphate aldolase [Christiangramia fulva]|uniref:Deoxyribose-phosphate aldolase n=1 Tax=Christiangramia fulva TaxID=2126553 RepID=A0A2R3Z6D5_9FLAO|nr:DUF6503 family protein [Christiangramia fulva]AVR45829.1 deoxyribose-phosphate aldolase [Christiangramia fulva]